MSGSHPNVVGGISIRYGSIIIQICHAFLDSIERCFGSAGKMELGQNVADMGSHRGFTDHQFPGNPFVGFPLGQHLEHIDLSFGERLRRKGLFRWLEDFFQHFTGDGGR